MCKHATAGGPALVPEALAAAAARARPAAATCEAHGTLDVKGLGATEVFHAVSGAGGAPIIMTPPGPLFLLSTEVFHAVSFAGGALASNPRPRPSLEGFQPPRGSEVLPCRSEPLPRAAERQPACLHDPSRPLPYTRPSP